MKKVVFSLIPVFLLSIPLIVSAESSIDEKETFEEIKADDSFIDDKQISENAGYDEGNVLIENQIEELQEQDIYVKKKQVVEETQNIESRHVGLFEDFNLSNSKSPDDWYRLGINEPSATNKVRIFAEALEIYPNDEKIINAYHDSVQNLLNWASKQHLIGNFNIAIDRYHFILSLKEINQSIINEVKWKLSFAEKLEYYPDPNYFYEKAMKETTASGRYNAFLEAYEYFPNNQLIINGLRESAINLLNWAIRQHNIKNYESAISRYKLLLNTPEMNSSFYNDVNKRLQDAVIGKRPADVILKDAEMENSASKKLELYNEGYRFYQDDQRFIDGIKNSSMSLLKWARNQHNLGNFDVAIDRYTKILELEILDLIITDSVLIHKEYAINKTKIPASSELLNNIVRENRASYIFEYSLKGYLYYPEKKEFFREFTRGSQLLLNYAINQQDSGKFEDAILRYRLLIDTPYVDNKIKEQVSYLMNAANNQVKSPDALYLLASLETKATNKLNLFNIGYEFYSHDNRFLEGLDSSARALLQWATNQHYSGNYDTAVERYSIIIDIEGIDNTIKQEALQKRDDALIGKRPADIIYSQAKEANNASEIFDLYYEGYSFYPNDTRFKKGLSEASNNLLNLAIRYHNQNKYGDAQSRYEKLLSADGVPDDINRKAEILNNFATSNNPIPTIHEYIHYAENIGTVSGILDAYVDGYILYDKDPRMEDGILKSARNLLNWASNQHQNGNFATALDRYNKVLGLPVINKHLKIEAEIKKDYALKSEFIPMADQLYEYANSQELASRLFDAFVDAYILYPNDHRFIEGVAHSSRALLDYATKIHNNGDYNGAISRYNKIIESPGVPKIIIIETNYKINYAMNKKKIPSPESLYNSAIKNNTATGRFDKALEGYILYPSNSQFEFPKQLELAALGLYSYALSLHEKSDYKGAISRYNKLIESPGVPEYLVTIVKTNKIQAENKKSPTNRSIVYSYYNYSLEQMINIQMSVNPQTDKYRNNTSAYIHQDNVRLESEINSTNVALRTDPNDQSSSAVYKRVGPGTKVEIVNDNVKGFIYNDSNLWYEIRYENRTLYVHSTLVSQVVVTTKNTKIYESNSSSSHAYATVKSGNTYTIKKKHGNWYEIEYKATWRTAKRADVEQYVNPEKQDMFQFLVLDQSTGISANQLNKLLSNKGVLHNKGNIFIEAGLKYGVNEIYLISHALLETGNGTSPLAVGVEVGLNSNNEVVLVNDNNRIKLKNIKTVYNMYGIGAYDNCALSCGAEYAYNKGWFSVNTAIIEGAAFVSNNFFARGQNTLYKMRWNPDNPGNYQYATDIGWADKQISRIKDLYNELDNPIIIFDIPVFK